MDFFSGKRRKEKFHSSETIQSHTLIEVESSWKGEKRGEKTLRGEREQLPAVYILRIRLFPACVRTPALYALRTWAAASAGPAAFKRDSVSTHSQSWAPRKLNGHTGSKIRAVTDTA